MSDEIEDDSIPSLDWCNLPSDGEDLDLDNLSPKEIIEKYCSKLEEMLNKTIGEPVLNKLDAYESFLILMKRFNEAVHKGINNYRMPLEDGHDQIFLNIKPELKIEFKLIQDYLRELDRVFTESLSQSESTTRATVLSMRILSLQSRIYMTKHAHIYNNIPGKTVKTVSSVMDNQELSKQYVEMAYNSDCFNDKSPFGVFLLALNEYMLYSSISMADKSFVIRENNIKFQKCVEFLFEDFKSKQQILVPFETVVKNNRQILDEVLWQNPILRSQICNWKNKIREHIESNQVASSVEPSETLVDTSVGKQEINIDGPLDTTTLTSINFKWVIYEFCTDMARCIDNVHALGFTLQKLHVLFKKEDHLHISDLAFSYLTSLQSEFEFILWFMTVCNYDPTTNALILKIIQRKTSKFDNKVPVFDQNGRGIKVAKRNFGFITNDEDRLMSIEFPGKIPVEGQDIPGDFIDKMVDYFEQSFKLLLKFFFQLALCFEKLKVYEKFYQRSICKEMFRFHKDLQGKFFVDKIRNSSLSIFIKSWSCKFFLVFYDQNKTHLLSKEARSIQDLIPGLYKMVNYGPNTPCLVIGLPTDKNIKLPF